MDLIEIASDFRKAIEDARDAGEFDRDQRFIQFPKACCGITTDLLAKFLIDSGFEGSLKYVGATCRKKALGLPSHAWLEIDDSVIIDITGDQFKNYPPPLEFNIPVYIGEYIDFFNSFEIDIKDNYYVNYILNDTHSRNYLSRAELYKIILKHLNCY